jgi:cell shape-determining protein MreC
MVTTSEYSNVFPPQIKIGFVSKVIEKPGSLFKEIDVTPSVDFASLEQVFIVTTLQDSERVSLEKRLTRIKK